jgi:hypothetical protein
MQDNPGLSLRAGCFGVAGSVIDGKCHTANLPWELDEKVLARAIDAPQVRLLNDPEAAGSGMLHLSADETCFASGAGMEMRRSVGTAMLWGAFGVTLFDVFLTPVFFYVIQRFVRAQTPAREPAAASAEGSSLAHGVATAVGTASSNGEPGT